MSGIPNSGTNSLRHLSWWLAAALLCAGALAFGVALSGGTARRALAQDQPAPPAATAPADQPAQPGAAPPGTAEADAGMPQPTPLEPLNAEEDAGQAMPPPGAQSQAMEPPPAEPAPPAGQAMAPEGAEAQGAAPQGAAAQPQTAGAQAAPEQAMPKQTMTNPGAPETAMPETAMPETAMPETAMPETPAMPEKGMSEQGAGGQAMAPQAPPPPPGGATAGQAMPEAGMQTQGMEAGAEESKAMAMPPAGEEAPMAEPMEPEPMQPEPMAPAAMQEMPGAPSGGPDMLHFGTDFQGDRYRKTTGFVNSAAHGNRLVMTYVSPPAVAKLYRLNADKLRREQTAGLKPYPEGTLIVLQSFQKTRIGGPGEKGPLFVMQKQGAGFDPSGGNWRYGFALPDFRLIGEGTEGSVAFCKACHAKARRSDYVFAHDR